MKNNNLYKKSFYSTILLIVALLFNVSLSFGQTEMTKLRDGSVSGEVKYSAAPYSILELESVSKGFLLPRMTTAQRNDLTLKITDKERGNGLAIYNTDNDCINYWSTAANKWLSVCGTLPPAKVTMDCTKIYLSASGIDELKQGESLKDTDILYVTVTVIESGSYSISAVTNNGYSFSKSGVFETAGTYSIALEGFGTPLQENEKPNGDAVVFKINGKDSPCTTFKIPVKSSALDFDIVDQTVQVTWSAYKGVPLNATDNTIKVKVNVKTPGYWRVQSDKADNGISFSGSGEFKETGETFITVYGQGTPLDVKNSTFKLVTNSKNNKVSNVSVTVNVVPTSFELVCDKENIKIRGDYKEDAVLNKSNSVLIPIKVIAPGVIDITLKGKLKGEEEKEVVFKADNTVLSFNGGDNIQYVTLYPEEIKVPIKATELVFTELIPNAGAFCTDFPTKEVTKRSKDYSFDCAATLMMAGSQNISENYFTVNTPLVKGEHGILVVVNVGYAEKYSIKTNELNGVYFHKTGEFTDEQKKAGRATIILEPVGKFTTAGNFYFSLYTEGMDSNLSNACSVVAQVRGRSFNVLSIGGSAYTPDPKRTNVAPYAILANSRNFGPTGKVAVDNINVFSYSSVGRTGISGLIANHNIDIVIIAYPASLNRNDKNDLVNFVRVQKGAIIIADELNYSGDQFSIELVRDLGTDGRTPTASRGSEVFSLVNPVIGPSDDPIISTSEFGSISGKLIGNDVASRGWYFKNLPSDYIPLVASQKDRTGIFAFRHDTLGFLFIGDGGAFAGNAENKNRHIWPAAITKTGGVLSKAYDGGTVYNSIFYANALKWAIEYVTLNKPRK